MAGYTPCFPAKASFKTVLATIALLLSFSLGKAQTIDKAKLDQFFDRLAEKNKAMGTVVLVKDGKEIYTRSIGYGQINGDQMKPLTAASRYRIASITKMYTTAMILQLAEEGKLKLTDPLSKFFPRVPNAEKITMQHILGHRSGIPNVRREQNPQNNVNTLPITRDELLDLIVKSKPDFEPGTKHLYSNTGYLLMGLLIEKVTGKSYAQALNERIVSRIGLKDTYLATGNIDVSKNEALTYMNSGGEWKPVPETHPSMLFSAGAIVSTPADMARFIQALFDGKIVSRQSLDQMKSIQDGDGLGMEPFTFAGRTFYGHTGGGDNYGSWLAHLPEERLTIAYTTNAKVYPVKDIVSGVLDIYYNKPFQIPNFETPGISTEILDQYIGVYSSTEAPVKFTVSRKDAILFIQANSETPAALEATSQNTFTIGGAIVLEFDASKKQMILKRAGGQRIFTKEN